MINFPMCMTTLAPERGGEGRGGGGGGGGGYILNLLAFLVLTDASESQLWAGPTYLCVSELQSAPEDNHA